MGHLICLKRRGRRKRRVRGFNLGPGKKPNRSIANLSRPRNMFKRNDSIIATYTWYKVFIGYLDRHGDRFSYVYTNVASEPRNCIEIFVTNCDLVKEIVF